MSFVCKIPHSCDKLLKKMDALLKIKVNGYINDNKGYEVQFKLHLDLDIYKCM